MYAVGCALMAFTACNQPAQQEVSAILDPHVYENLPFKMEKVIQPSGTKHGSHK